MLAVRQFVFFNRLHHLQAGHLLAVKTRDELGEKFRSLLRELARAAVYRLAQFGRQRAGAGIGGKRGTVGLHLLAKVRGRHISLACQEKAGERISRVQNVEGAFPKRHQLRRGTEIQSSCRTVFHGLGRVLADRFPGAKY